MFNVRAYFWHFSACFFCSIIWRAPSAYLKGFSNRLLPITAVSEPIHVLRNSILGIFAILFATFPNFVFVSRHSLSIHTSLSLSSFRFYIFCTIWPHPHLPRKRDELTISTETFISFCWKCRARTTFLFLLFNRLGWNLRRSSAGFMVRKFALPLNDWNMFQSRQSSGEDGPASAPSLGLWVENRFGWWAKSRWAKSFGLSNRYRCLETLTSMSWKIFTQVFYELPTLFSFVLIEACLPLIVISGVRKILAWTISGALETPSSNKAVLFFDVTQFFNQLEIKNKYDVAVQSRYGNRSGFLVQRLMEAWTVVRERAGLRSWESVVLSYIL